MAESFKDLGREGAIEALYAGSDFRQLSSVAVEAGKGGVCTQSHCLMTEGIDFDLKYFPFEHLGYKAVVRVTGPLSAALSEPRCLSVVIGVSSKLDMEEISKLWKGITTAAAEFSFKDVALDLRPSLTGLYISLSASGWKKKAGTAKPSSKDLICISNNVGAAFLGGRILQRGIGEDESGRKKLLEDKRQLVAACLKPELPHNLSGRLAEAGVTATSGYFCGAESFSAVLRRMQRESGLGVKIYVDKLPFASGSIDAASDLGIDPLQAALKGGDDNVILLTIPIGEHDDFCRDFQAWDVIGHLAQPEVGTVLVSPDGLEHRI